MAEVGEPFTRPQLEVFLAGLLMQGDGEATIENLYVKAGEAAADGIRMRQLCHTNGDVTIELGMPWPTPCRRTTPLQLDAEGKCWRCGWESVEHRQPGQGLSALDA